MNPTIPVVTPVVNIKQKLSKMSQSAQARHYLPEPSCREAPKFKKEEPENLLRFLKSYERLLTQVNITRDQEKLANVGQYVDARTENEWRAFESFQTGSWDAFKKELLQSYPEAVDFEEGSVQKLDEVCRNNLRIGVHDLSALQKLKREFMAEAWKLTKVVPRLVSNRELVQKFAQCLDKSFRDSVFARMGIQSSVATSSPAAAGTAVPGGNAPVAVAAVQPPERSREDRYDLEQVIKTAIDLAEGSYVFAGEEVETTRSLASLPASKASSKTKEELDDVKMQMAQIKDSITTSNNTNKKELDKILEAVNQTKNSGENSGSSRQSSSDSSSNNAARPSINKLGERRCYYCNKLGHMLPNCPDKEQHLVEGKIKEFKGRYVLADGSQIKREPMHLSIKEKVELACEKAYANLFFNDDDNASVFQQSEETLKPNGKSVLSVEGMAGVLDKWMEDHKDQFVGTRSNKEKESGFQKVQ